MKSKAPLPKVGRPVRGSQTGRPIMVLLDLLGRRSALRVLWELREGKPLTFRLLQQAAATNPGLLNTRLTELRAAGLIGHEGEGYLLTSTGKELLRALNPLSAWARKWGLQQQGSEPPAPRPRQTSR